MTNLTGLNFITRRLRIIGGISAIVGGLFIIIMGPILFFPFFSRSEERLLWFVIGAGIITALGGGILIYDKVGGGVLAVISGMMSFGLIILSDIWGSLDMMEMSPWVVIGPGISAFGGFLGILTNPECKIIKKQNTIIQETLISVESKLFENHGVKAIEYFGHYFGGLLFLTEFNEKDYGLKIGGLISFLENILNQKIILALKMIPNSSQFEDTMYYLYRLKREFLKFSIKRMEFFK